MFFKRITTESLSIFSYVLACEKTKEALVIDPPRTIFPILSLIEEEGFTLKALFETHVHADFVTGVNELKAIYKEGMTIYTSGMGGKDWIPAYADVIIDQNQTFRFGSLRIDVIHTPGHTKEHVSYLVFDEERSIEHPLFLFTGDTIFSGSVGRPDLLKTESIQEMSEELYKTLFNRLVFLPDDLEIFPAHGAGSLCGKKIHFAAETSLGFERDCNPYFKCSSFEEWMKLLLHDLPKAPAYFEKVKKMNLEGPTLLSTLETKRMTFESEKDLSLFFTIDVRHPDLFANGHYPKSLNLILNHSFSRLAGRFLPSDKPICIVGGIETPLDKVVQTLRLMGFDQLIVTTIFNASHSFAVPMKTISTTELAQQGQKNALFLIDVRTIEEWEDGHLPFAHLIEIDSILEQMHTIPLDKPIAVICRSGMRASTAASLLIKYGFENVSNVKQGMLPFFKKPN